MKKLFLLAELLLFLAPSLRAQLVWDLRAGINVSGFTESTPR